jgi:hypothetical protein
MSRNRIFVAKVFFNTININLQENILDGLWETVSPRLETALAATMHPHSSICRLQQPLAKSICYISETHRIALSRIGVREVATAVSTRQCLNIFLHVH